MGKIVGRADFERLLKETVASNPTRTSPRTDAGECLYRGPDGASCLIAEVLVGKLGFSYDPAWEGREPPNLLVDLGFDEDTADVARKWQDDPANPPAAWGTLLG